MAGMNLMRSQTDTGFHPPYPQVNPITGRIHEIAENLHSLHTYFHRQNILSPKGDKVISLDSALTAAEYCDIKILGEAIQTQFQDVLDAAQ